MSKKVIAMLMAAMISVSLAGCSFSSKEDSTKSSQEVVEDETESTGKWARDFTLKDFTQTSDELISKVEKQTKEYGLKSALAGSVKKDQLKPLYDIGCDVVGVRGAACTGGDRNKGTISSEAVKELKDLIASFE